MLFRLLIALMALLNAKPVFAQHDGHAAAHTGHFGAGIMPFDLNRSLHVFTPMPTGGTQTVLSLDADAAQVDLIRTHLRKEAAAFAQGDYADPAAIHGAAMPGLATLGASNGRVNASFEPLPQGARIRFETTHPDLVIALHQWFEAQVHDHGADAIIRQP